MALTPQDIKDKQFTTTRGFGEGYVETEVDDFLDEVYEEFARLADENARLRGSSGAPPAPASPPVSATKLPPAAAQASAKVPAADLDPPAAAPATPTPTFAGSAADGAMGILALAQKTADEHMADARKQAERILSEARTSADSMSREVEDKRRKTLGALEHERSTLERKIDDLRAYEREYRSRLKAYLEAQLRDLDGTKVDSPRAIGADGSSGTSSGSAELLATTD